MNPRFSLYLDAVRFAAALLVLLSHFAYPRFSHGDFIILRDLNLGSDAVAVFFVLSGLVIAFAAETKDKSLSAFGFSRATRIFSVAAPAVILGLSLDALGAHLAPAPYDGWWYNDEPAPLVALRALTFTNELWLGTYRVGTNGPYWSLAYEVWFYALFAAGFYLRGAKRALVIALMALIVGPKVLLLAPVWLCGVWCWDRIKTPQSISRRAAFALAVAPPVLYVAALALGVPHLIRAASESLFGEAFLTNGLAFSDEFIWNLAIAIAAAAHFIGMARLFADTPAPQPNAIARAVRWLSGATFSIYLVHYPLMQFIDSMLPAGLDKHLSQAIVLFPTLALCFLFAHAFERPLPLWRRLVRKAMNLTALQPRPAMR